MRRQMNFVVFPLQTWEHTDLTLLEKCVLLELSSYPADVLGCTFREGQLATSLAVPKKDIKQAIASLVRKGGLVLSLDADGKKWYSPLLYQERYLPDDAVVEETVEKEAIKLDYDFIAAQWAEHCPMLRPVERMTSLRKSKIRTLLNKNQATVGDLIRCFRIIGVSGFLQHGTDGRWQADFDWVIRDNKGQFQKILEGGYCNTFQERAEYERIIGGLKKEAPNDDVYK